MECSIECGPAILAPVWGKATSSSSDMEPAPLEDILDPMLPAFSAASHRIAAYSRLDILGLRYKFVSFGAEKRPGSPIW